MRLNSQSRARKLLSLLVLSSLTIFLVNCDRGNDPFADDYDQLLQAKEQQFIESLNFPDDATAKLIGFKTVFIDHESLERFNEFYLENKAAIDNLEGRFYNPIKGEYRTYFPVRDAIIDVAGAEYEADHEADLRMTTSIDLTDAEVIGRMKSARVSGVPENRIVGDKIFLRNPVRVNHMVENVMVFDFGRKDVMNHDHGPHGVPNDGIAGADTMGVDTTYDPDPDPDPDPDTTGTDTTYDPDPDPIPGDGEEEGDSTVSCMNNHITAGGVKQNCTTAGIVPFQGRCPFNAAVCMDYNGIFTDCINHGGGWRKYTNFIGSDCDWALAAGECWNEIM